MTHKTVFFYVPSPKTQRPSTQAASSVGAINKRADQHPPRRRPARRRARNLGGVPLKTARRPSATIFQKSQLNQSHFSCQERLRLMVLPTSIAATPRLHDMAAVRLQSLFMVDMHHLRTSTPPSRISAPPLRTSTPPLRIISHPLWSSRQAPHHPLHHQRQTRSRTLRRQHYTFHALHQRRGSLCRAARR